MQEKNLKYYFNLIKENRKILIISLLISLIMIIIHLTFFSVSYKYETRYTVAKEVIKDEQERKFANYLTREYQYLANNSEIKTIVDRAMQVRTKDFKAKVSSDVDNHYVRAVFTSDYKDRLVEYAQNFDQTLKNQLEKVVNRKVELFPAKNYTPQVKKVIDIKISILLLGAGFYFGIFAILLFDTNKKSLELKK